MRDIDGSCVYAVRYVHNVRRTSATVKPIPSKTSKPEPRRRRPRGSLTPEAILDVAEARAAEGMEGVSMRTIAARLGAVPMALYNHFATKDALVDALLDRVLHRYDPPPPTGDWLADLASAARAHRAVLAAHPWAVPVLVTRPNPGLGSVRIGEHMLGILSRGGLSDDRMMAAFSGVIAFNYGWSSFAAARDLDPAGPTSEVTAMLEQLPAQEFPLIVRTAGLMGAYGSDAHYEYVLGDMLAGLGRSTVAG